MIEYALRGAGYYVLPPLLRLDLRHFIAAHYEHTTAARAAPL